MATSKEFKDYVLEKLSCLNNIVCKPMMGEFLLYYNGTLFGGIYDGQLLIKKSKTNADCALPEVVPYNGAKRTMFLFKDLDNKEALKQLILNTCKGL